MKKDGDKIKRLGDLKSGLGEELPEHQEAPGDPPPGPEEGQKAAMEINPDEAADMLLTYADGFCEQAGLTPLNTVQRFLIRMGIVGCAKKYSLSFDLDKYPELAIIAGVSWVTVDKIREYKAKKEAEDLKQKTESAPKPESEDTKASVE